MKDLSHFFYLESFVSIIFFLSKSRAYPNDADIDVIHAYSNDVDIDAILS